MNLALSLVVLALCCFTGWCGAGTADLNLTSYGLPEATFAGSCNSQQGTFVDRQFEATCFPRQVTCSLTGVISSQVCDAGQTFIADNDPTCYDPGSAAALAQCDATVMCGLDGITVHVGDDAVFGQTSGALQFGDNTNPSAPAASQCQISHSSSSYTGTLFFDISSNGPNTDICGIPAPTVGSDTAGDGYYIQYEFQVMRWIGRGSEVFVNENTERVEDYDSSTGVVITREKCFMLTVQCNYNPDGTVSASYQPSTPNALDEHDENRLEFEMLPINCATGAEINPVVVFVGVEVCFVNKITTVWHENIRISSTRCWATPSSSPNDADFYRLTDHATVHETTFDWLCNGDAGNHGSTSGFTNAAYEEAFKFTSFRFQSETKTQMQDVATYSQTIYVHCEVNACDIGDITSTDCVPHCGGAGISRSRRDTNRRINPMLPKLTKTRTLSTAIIMPPDDRRYLETPSYNLLSDTLSLGLFAVGCVFGVVALGMFFVMRRQNQQLKYRILNGE